jgi:hypothetical protein
MRSLHLLPTQPKVASWKGPKNKVLPISVQYHEPWIPGKITYLQFNHTSTNEPYNVLKKNAQIRYSLLSIIMPKKNPSSNDDYTASYSNYKHANQLIT